MKLLSVGRRISCVISLLIAVTACQPSSSRPAGWRVGRVVEHVIPQAQIALTTQNVTAALAWAGAPNLPNLQLALDEQPPIQLALGITPRQLSIVPLQNRWLQLLWLDQTMPGDVQLMGGTVDAQGALQRGPTAISNMTTMEYAAVPTPNGASVVLWNTPAIGASANTALYLQMIDAQGRPLPAQRITTSGRFPALA